MVTYTHCTQNSEWLTDPIERLRLLGGGRREAGKYSASCFLQTERMYVSLSEVYIKAKANQTTQDNSFFQRKEK